MLSIQTYFPPDLSPEYRWVYLYKPLILINTVLFIHCPALQSREYKLENILLPLLFCVSLFIAGALIVFCTFPTDLFFLEVIVLSFHVPYPALFLTWYCALKDKKVTPLFIVWLKARVICPRFEQQKTMK